LWEGGTGGGVGGSAAAIHNRRRDSEGGASTVITAVTKDSSPVTGGTLLFEHTIGAGNFTGGGSRGAEEWVLAPNTQYYVEIYDTTAINAFIELEWYEHTDKG